MKRFQIKLSPIKVNEGDSDVVNLQLSDLKFGAFTNDVNFVLAQRDYEIVKDKIYRDMERNLVFPVFNVYVFIMLVVNIVYLILIDINNKCIEYYLFQNCFFKQNANFFFDS